MLERSPPRAPHVASEVVPARMRNVEVVERAIHTDGVVERRVEDAAVNVDPEPAEAWREPRGIEQRAILLHDAPGTRLGTEDRVVAAARAQPVFGAQAPAGAEDLRVPEGEIDRGPASVGVPDQRPRGRSGPAPQRAV